MSGFDALLSADSQNKPGDSKLIDCINTKSGESFEILPQYRYHLIEDSNYRSRCTYKFEIALIAQKDNFVNNIQKDSCDDTVLVEEGNINTDEIYINSIKLSEDDLCKLGGFYKSQISPKKINLVSPDDLKWAEYTLSCRDWIILEDNLLSIDIDLIRCVNTLAFRIGVRVDSRLNYLDLKISSISCANEVELLKKINNLIIKCRNCGLELESISNFYPFSLPSELYRNSIGSIYCEECQDNLVKDKSGCDDLQVSRKHNILYISDEAITVNSPSKELVKNKILHYNRKNKEESLGINGVEGGHISCSKCKIAIGSNNSSSVSYIKSRVAAIAEGYDLFWRNSESVEIIEKIQFEDSLKLTLRFNSESISIIKVTREPDTFIFVQNNPVLTSRILYKIETTGAENSDNRNKSVDKDAEKNANSHREERREFKMKPVILEICQGFESSNRIYESYKRGHQDEYEDVMNGKVEGSVLGSDHASKYEREYGSTDEIFRKIKNVLTNPGGLVAIPTETVYGLAGNIYIEESLRRIFEIKNRPFNDPLIVHVDSFTSALEDLYDVNVFEAFLMLYLANRFTPGPLTIVARCNRGVSGLLTNNTGYLATRCPDNEICRALLRYLNIPLAAPSANKFGHISPTCAEHVYEEFAHEKLHILDGGQCKIGIESTVIKITTIDEPEIICIDNRYTFSGIKEQVVKRVYRECRKAVVDMYGERDSTAGSGYTTDSGSKKEHTYMHKRALSPDDFRADEAEEQLASPRRAVVSCVNGRIDLFDLLKKYQNVKFKVEILRKGAVTYEHLRYTLSGFENVKVTEYERRPEKKSESEKAREEKVVSEVMAEDRILPEDLLEDTIVSDHILEDVIVPEGMVEDVIVPEPVLEDRIVSDHILEDVIVPEVMLEDVIAPERMLEHRIAPEGVLDEKVLFEDALADKLVPKALLEDNVDIFENIEKYKLLEKELEDLSNGTLTVSGLRNIISTLKRLRAQKAMSSMSTAADEFLSARDYNEEDYLTVNDIDDIISVDQFDCNDDDYMSVDEADNSMVCFIDDLSDGLQKDNKGAVVPGGIADTIANGYVDCISEGTVNSCANSMYGSPNPVASAISDGSVNSIYGTPNGIPDSFANAIVNRAVNMASGGALGGDNGTAVGSSAGTVANGATNGKDAYQGTEGDRTGDPGATSAENSVRTNASRINNSYVRRLLDRALDNNDTGKDKDIIIDEISGKNSFCFDDLGKGGVDGHDNEDGGKQQPVSDEDDLRFEAPGMALTHYAPNVPTYLVVVTKDNTTLSGSSGDEDGDDRARTEGPVGGAASGANNGSTLKKVDCSNIVMIDIGYRFKRHSGAFREYLPVNNEPTSVAKQLYSVLRRAESAAQHGAGGPSDVQAVIAIHFNERKTQLYSAIHDRITRSTSGNPIYAQIGDQELEFLVN
ncbi:uncharacterized protein TOT_030000376 [Theileria orientalis strain Shintoku]|uniref:Threonylcarbamoyl-AMP synthase n=1 Tax=Theileria orientalis strain Shintoku TaxID=869250 RepID=J4C8N8_THEOR|nr:uncharacterized protein TOT_030000376 [Theileria orientalis strain Shintoku]BAM41113.1 uncharacterized protein TOT_030000376 [Theileria orientalis strain Shintoku]|eukprot:XP_009691414.1 uncharacterized protein TOT_030000376 [Theileria orientalis strain Shintoku]